jgi:flagellum-specific peptidoglycan hydrolase FlgJ
MTTEQQTILTTRIAPAALAAERATGCPAELTVAQCVLESGYLTHAPGNNCFGIKSYEGCFGTQLLDTSEWLTSDEAAHFVARGEGRSAILVLPARSRMNGRKLYACRDVFATFPTLAHCFAYHGELLQRGVYRDAWERYQRDHDLDALIRGVARHYATDPQYALVVAQIARAPLLAAAVVQGRNAAQNA